MLSAAVVAADAQTPPGTTTTTTTSTTTTTTAPATIPPGVTIAGVAVGGLTVSAAVQAVQAAFATPLPLVVAGHRLAPAPSALGASIAAQKAVDQARGAAAGTSIQVVVSVRLERLRAYVAQVAKRFDRPPRDSQLLLRKLKPFITKGTAGRVLDRPGAVRAISTALLKNRRDELVLRSKKQAQAVTRDDFGPAIVIRRGSNRLYLYDGMRQIRIFGVATGQTKYPTPLGRFSIVVKWRNPWWFPPDSPWAKDEKPIPPGPSNPLGTRWMGISAPGVGIHGTNNESSIGYSVSHGCIRMHVRDAEWLFNRVGIGTPVFIVAA
jgi:lipoprotein-anchoring transpeptidase ErfK/SrfK